jgi:autotransporter adhesin
MNAQSSAMNASVNALHGMIHEVNRNLANVRREERSGVAATSALATAAMPSKPGKTSFVVNAAIFKDQPGVGASFAHRLDTNAPIAVTGGVAWAPGTSNLVGRAGLMGEF